MFWGSAFLIRVFAEVFFRQHTFMQDTGNKNFPFPEPVKNDVLAAPDAMKTGANFIAGTA